MKEQLKQVDTLLQQLRDAEAPHTTETQQLYLGVYTYSIAHRAKSLTRHYEWVCEPIGKTALEKNENIDYVFDDIIFNAIAMFDYIGYLVIQQLGNEKSKQKAEQRDTAFWNRITCWAKDNCFDTPMNDALLAADTSFVSWLYEYRAKIIHRHAEVLPKTMSGYGEMPEWGTEAAAQITSTRVPLDVGYFLWEIYQNELRDDILHLAEVVRDTQTNIRPDELSKHFKSFAWDEIHTGRHTIINRLPIYTYKVNGKDVNVLLHSLLDECKTILCTSHVISGTRLIIKRAFQYALEILAVLLAIRNINSTGNKTQEQ